MKAIVLYESFFGNTAQIAQAIGKAQNENIKVFQFSEITWQQIKVADFIIVGSPTRKFRPCENTLKFLKNIPQNGIKGKKIAAFDTRISLDSIKSKPLKFIVDKGGYAAKHILKSLKKNGGIPILPPEGFFVADEKGPLVKGELERATNWAEKLLTSS